jgi:transcriptional regulator with XRE-family HTH domain
MTSHKTMSLGQELESFPRGAQELSAARLARDVDGLLHRAFKASGLLQGALATKLGVSESAVSQVLNSEGNVRISTLGRYLRALGYEAKLHLIPVEEGAPVIEETQRRRRNASRSAHEQAAPQPERSRSSREVHWTVLDKDRNVFAINVALQDNTVTGTTRFSGSMPSYHYSAVTEVQVPVKASTRVTASR